MTHDTMSKRSYHGATSRSLFLLIHIIGIIIIIIILIIISKSYWISDEGIMRYFERG